MTVYCSLVHGFAWSWVMSLRTLYDPLELYRDLTVAIT